MCSSAVRTSAFRRSRRISEGSISHDRLRANREKNMYIYSHSHVPRLDTFVSEPPNTQHGCSFCCPHQKVRSNRIVLVILRRNGFRLTSMLSSELGAITLLSLALLVALANSQHENDPPTINDQQLPIRKSHIQHHTPLNNHENTLDHVREKPRQQQQQHIKGGKILYKNKLLFFYK